MAKYKTTKTYDSPNEWMNSLDSKPENNTHWFCSHTNQEKILFSIAKEIYFLDNGRMNFEDALEEAEAIISVFYNYKYNPNTRK